ncbi:MAG: hypothetical protein O2890_15260 [Cyanobacteria bacterium]|nr:hypothetical protein [Cyanobacteriota bacterium]
MPRPRIWSKGQIDGAATSSGMVLPPDYDDAPRGDRFDSISLDD